MEDTIVVSAHFEGGAGDAKCRYFERLDAALKTHGKRLHLLNLNSKALTTTCSWEALPWTIEKAHWLPIHRVARPSRVDASVAHAASIDALCWKRSQRAEESRVLLFREHLRRLIARRQPRLHIAWHQFFSFHYCLPDMLREFSIPLLFAEYGPLPGTIIFDRDGQMAESPIAKSPQTFRALPISDEDRDHARAYMESVRAEKRSRKKQSGDARVAQALSKCGQGNRPVIFYAGQYDCRTGMVPRSLPGSRAHSPWFDGTMDALRHLVELATRNDWLILFKPHPLATVSADELDALPGRDRLITLPDASIFDCFEHAQLVVTIVSQVSYMALIHGKPCVLLGGTYLSGSGCAYEPANRGAIEAGIVSALAAGLDNDRRHALVDHVARLLRYGVFQFDSDLDAAGVRSTDEAANFLSESAQATTSGFPSEGRDGPRHPDADSERPIRRLYEILTCLPLQRRSAAANR